MSIVEITRFRLAHGVTDAAFLVLDRRVQTELVPNRPGFMRRTTARRGEEWVVVTLWSTAEAAAAFEEAAREEALQGEFEEATQADSFQQVRYTTLD